MSAEPPVRQLSLTGDAEQILELGRELQELATRHDIHNVMTDNGWAYTHAAAYRAVLDRLGARHRRTRPFRPQTNGKAERFIKTLLAEWAYGKLYRSNVERLAALPRWVDFYNHGRPHTSLDAQVPMTALVNNVRGNHN